MKPEQKSTTATKMIKQQYATPIIKDVQPKSNTKPESDWALAKSDVNPYQKQLYNAKQPAVVESDDTYFSFTDLDYEDFEAAMYEEEHGYLHTRGEKESPEPIESFGLESGDSLPLSIWNSLVLLTGGYCDSTKLLRPGTDLLVVFVDPRRLSYEYREVMSQMAQVPYLKLKASMITINCEENVEIKKYLKKCRHPVTSVNMMFDPTEKVSSI
jgi:hypothetical protein